MIQIDLSGLALIPITVILGLLTYLAAKRSRYGYLANRWNSLMNTNVEEVDFYDSEKTRNYRTFNPQEKTKYFQHARMYWGFVEDVIRADYPVERLLGVRWTRFFGQVAK